jgi:enoyl-CoA hydratase/carnithine racemase
MTMEQKTPEVRMTIEGHICVISLDNVSKKNAITPALMFQVIAADAARFCQLESKRGIAPLGGAHFRYLTRTGWGNAMYHLFLCDGFGAEEALRIGFVQEVHPYGKHRERAMEIARRICKCAPLGLCATKAAALAW